MRISLKEQAYIKTYFKNILPNGKVFLFGSRADDTKKGGDIDILVTARRKISFDEKMNFLKGYWKMFGEQRIDVVSRLEHDTDSFFLFIQSQALELSD